MGVRSIKMPDVGEGVAEAEIVEHPPVCGYQSPASYDRCRGLDMTALGFALLLMGATLVVAEAHVPGGVLGVTGGMALIAGGIIATLGGGAALAVAGRNSTGRRSARAIPSWSNASAA